MKKKLAVWVALAAAVLLVACGGNNTIVEYNANKLYQDRAAALFPNVAELKYGDSFGTGFIYTTHDGKPILLTNFHMSGTDSFRGEDLAVRLYGSVDYQQNVAQVLAYDAMYDIVVLRLTCAPPAHYIDLRAAAQLSPQAGDSVLLIGNSTGNGLSVFDGIVSAKEKVIEIADKTLAVLSTTAAINAGCSGCPLVGLDGQFLGVGFAQSNEFAGRPVQDMNYAIPAEIVDAIYELAIRYDDDALHAGGQIPHLADIFNLTWRSADAKAGAQAVHLGFNAQFTASGFTVTDVFDETKTGLRVKDVIKMINGRAADGFIGITAALYRSSPADADKLRFCVLRDGVEMTVNEN